MKNIQKFENIEAIQFNGWNFGAIYDCVRETIENVRIDKMK